jgi:hypothetical protein
VAELGVRPMKILHVAVYFLSVTATPAIMAASLKFFFGELDFHFYFRSCAIWILLLTILSFSSYVISGKNGVKESLSTISSFAALIISIILFGFSFFSPILSIGVRAILIILSASILFLLFVSKSKKNKAGLTRRCS